MIFNITIGLLKSVCFHRHVLFDTHSIYVHNLDSVILKTECWILINEKLGQEISLVADKMRGKVSKSILNPFYGS